MSSARTSRRSSSQPGCRSTSSPRPLLAVMVLSAAATSSLISRNERSLLHSYHAQERRIRKWFEMFAVISGSADKKQLVETILSFEDIMLNDLLDFIHITSRDVIETPGF